MKTKEMEKMEQVVEKIGKGPLCMNESFLEEVQKTLLEKGYATAEVLVSQRAGADEQDEITRALAICQKYGLSPGAGARVVQNLNIIKSGKW